MSDFKRETLCVQAGWKPTTGEPRVLPIYQSTTFKYDTSDAMGRLFDLEDEGYFYTRLQDSFGTACNVTGDGALTLIISGYVNKHEAK